MRRLAVAILLVAVLALSCGQGSQNTSITPEVNSDLGQMLAEIPSELASSNMLWFSNMERVREMAGAGPDIDYASYTQLLRSTADRQESQRLMDLLSGLMSSQFSGEKYSEYWKDAFGYDMFMLDREIMVEESVPPNAKRPLFSVMKAGFDKSDMVGKLDGLGYERKSYDGMEFYSINADYQLDMRSSGAGRMAMGFLNRMLVNEQEIIAAPADEIFFQVLNVRLGKEKSLGDSIAYTTVAASLGDVLGAAIIPRSQLQSKNVSTEWGELHEYDLAAIGYWMEGRDKKVVIVLHYPNKSAASDIEELKRRMAGYVLMDGHPAPRGLADLFEIGEPAATAYEKDSVLKVELAYKANTRSYLWNTMVTLNELGFLVANPAK